MRDKLCYSIGVGLCLILILLTACGTAIPPATPTVAYTPTPVPSPTPTPTPSPLEAVEAGDAFFKRSDFAGAIEAYERAIAIDPEFAPAYSGLSMVYLFQRIKITEALTQAQEGAAAAPESGYAHAVLAWVHMAMDAPTLAIESAERAVELEPENAFVQAVLALAYLEDNRFEDARHAAEEAYELNDQLPEALYALGNYYERTGDFSRALAAYEGAAQLESEFAGWQLILGEFFYQSGRYQQASQAFESALALDSHYLPAILGLAWVKTEQKEYDEAAARLEEGRQIAPQEANVYIDTGFLYLEQRDYQEALEQFNKALDLEPGSYWGRDGIGAVYLYQDECEQARQQFQTLVTDYPNWSEPRVGRGWADICAGNLDRAMTHFREAVKLNPFSASAQGSLGWGYLYQQRWESANQAFIEALRLSQFPSRQHSDLGHYYWNQGLLEQAEAEFKLAAEINPYDIDVKLSLGELLLDQERIEEAAANAEQAFALDPTDKDTLSFQGRIFNLQGKHEEAVDILKQALEADPDAPANHLHLGLAYRDLSDYPQAKKEIETYLALAGNELSEDDFNRLSFLISNLDSGYTISEEKALDEMEEFFVYILGDSPEMLVEDLEEGGRALVLEMPLTEAEVEQESYFETSGIFVAITSLYVPRIDPAIENGLLIRFTRRGKEWLTIEMSLLSLKQIADTLLPADFLIEHMDFSLAEDTVPQYSIDKMIKDLARQIELDSNTSPPYKTITQEEVHDHLAGSLDEEARTSIQKDASVLQLLGLITPTLNLEDVWVNLYTEQTAGFYTPDEGQIYLVETDEPSAMDQIVLAHEVVHALQDRAFDLEELDDPGLNDDQSLALDALIEGSATLASVFYLQENIPEVILIESASQAGNLETEALEAAPDFISNMLNFPYSPGFEFAQALHARDGWKTVNQAFTDLPLSTEQILHPERYFSADKPVEVTLPDLGSAFGDLLEETNRNVMGEYGLLLAQSEYIGPAAAAQAVEGWGGDTYLLLHNKSDDTDLLVLQTTWDDQDESDDFWKLFGTAMYHRVTYTEIVESLVGELTSRTWKSDKGFLLASQNEKDVTILIGPELSILEEILSTIDE